MATINDYLMGRCNVGFSNNGPVRHFTRVVAIFQTTSDSDTDFWFLVSSFWFLVSGRGPGPNLGPNSVL